MLFPAMTASSSRRAASGRWLHHAAARSLGIGETDELVADDVVRDAERALELVQGAALGQHVEHDVVAVLLLVDRVGVLATTPPVDLAVHRAARPGDRVRDGLDPRPSRRVFEVTIDDDHEFVGTRHCVWNLPSDPMLFLQPGAPERGRVNMTPGA